MGVVNGRVFQGACRNFSPDATGLRLAPRFRSLIAQTDGERIHLARARHRPKGSTYVPPGPDAPASAKAFTLRQFLWRRPFAITAIVLSVTLVVLVSQWPLGRGDVAQREIGEFLESYFRVWSAGDVPKYQSHFDDSARIAFAQNGQVVECQELEPFIRQQAKILGAAKGSLVERMTSFHAQSDTTTAHVTAHWELTNGSEKTIGVDRFTLLRDPQGQWKILYLVFYHGSG